MSRNPFEGMSRREFLAKVTAAGGTAMLASWATPIIEKAYATPVASGSAGPLQGIEHIVLFMQENHSFDNYFGTRYGVNGFGNTPMPQSLERAGVSWKVYNANDLGPVNGIILNGLVSAFKQALDPKTNLWAKGITPRYPLNFALDVAADRLPSVSWVVAPVLECEHPALPVSLGSLGIVNLLRILLSNPKVWAKTALIVSYDEHGGFFDHVTPPTPPPGTPGEYIPESIVNDVPGSGGISGPVGLGYRVPCLVISPYSRGGRVDSTVYDHTSQLRLIETRFGARVPNLPDGSWRREITGDMTKACDFSTFDPSRPNLGTPFLGALPKLPQCIPNVVTGYLNKGNPYPVPFPQTMPVQETGPPALTPA